MQVKELIDYLNLKFRPEYQENYDNSGFLVGDPTWEIKGVLVTVDITPEVIEEAIDKGCNVVVSHHPLIFGGIKRITPSNELGRMLLRIIEQRLCIYAAHTNLDNLDWGINGILAQKIGLMDCHILQPQSASTPNVGAGMIGMLPQPIEMQKFMSLLKDRLGLPTLRSSRPINNTVQRVAICGGSGSFLIAEAKHAGADIFITADLKYHDFQRAENEITLVDVGHFESEQFAKELIYSVISEKFCTFACRISEKNKGYIYYI